MGKIILEFDSVEEAVEAQTALDGYKWKMAMWELDQELRATVKYRKPILEREEGEATDAEMDAADKVREKIREILETYSLNLID